MYFVALYHAVCRYKWLMKILEKLTNSGLDAVFWVAVLKKLTISVGKHTQWSPIFSKVAGLSRQLH